MQDKKIIVNYCQAWGESGTHYDQQIKIDLETMKAFNKYLYNLKRKAKRNFAKRRSYTEEETKILYLEYLHGGINYTNLIHLHYFIVFYLNKLYTPPKKDKDFERILNRNTLIIVKEEKKGSKKNGK